MNCSVQSILFTFREQELRCSGHFQVSGMHWSSLEQLGVFLAVHLIKDAGGGGVEVVLRHLGVHRPSLEQLHL